MIIPNWHPIFVHFTVALLIFSALLFVLPLFIKGPLREQWNMVARWTLWFGIGITVITGLTGLYAYNTVAHDAPSHLAMEEHRNWAVATIAAILLLGAWSIVWIRKGKALGGFFVAGMVAAALLVASTAWHGGELVYRFGLGVMSLPKADEHHHTHSEGAEEHSHATPEAATGDSASSAHDHEHEHADGDEHHAQ